MDFTWFFKMVHLVKGFQSRVFLGFVYKLLNCPWELKLAAGRGSARAEVPPERLSCLSMSAVSLLKAEACSTGRVGPHLPV